MQGTKVGSGVHVNDKDYIRLSGSMVVTIACQWVSGELRFRVD